MKVRFEYGVMSYEFELWVLKIETPLNQTGPNSHICPVKYVNDLSFLDTPWPSISRAELLKKN